MTSFSINPLPRYVEDKAGALGGLRSTESGLLLVVRFDAAFPARGDLYVADDGGPADPTAHDPGSSGWEEISALHIERGFENAARQAPSGASPGISVSHFWQTLMMGVISGVANALSCCIA